MGLLDPALPDYDPLDWARRPFSERARMVCDSWVLQGYGAPLPVYLAYSFKALLYIGGWLLACRFTPGLGELGTLSAWWLEPTAFHKAIVWSMLFEILGLGCGSGPLTGRYLPPVGGFLYFLRPGTTKLALFPGVPVIGGHRRGWLDVVLYAATVGVCLWALSSAAVGREQVIALVVLVPLLGILDKTLFLAARGEHYWTTLVVLLFADDWIAGAKAVMLALWFWAGVSKLNHHFPTVVSVMTSNSPFTRRLPWLRRMMVRSYPEDMRPSTLATILAHAGTALEIGVPLVLALSPGGDSLVLGIVLMLFLHGYITSNVPMGVPIEWNIMMVYGGFALFWAHPEVTVLDLGPPGLALFLVAMLVGVPLLGNLMPERVSFLLAMRYYAGNWPVSIWLFRGESHRRLERLCKSSGWIEDQLGRFYDEATRIVLFSKVLAFRLMHLHGRALGKLLPRAVDDLDERTYVDGELIAGLVLGWNFGDGHLH
ncbi:MAG: DUF3556 domain-containing protein, partial [Myxococcales bacterium]|nr:DUF3556 domain-containing protein [Myxococcales bacterium]